MKKLCSLILLIAMNSFAIYFDGGIGFGGASTEVGNIDFGKACGGECDEIAVDLGLRVGGQINERFWIAGEFGGVGNRYYDSENYIQFNSYFIGPSFIFYPVEHLHLSGSLGYSWTSNNTDINGLYLYDGSGAALSLTVAYDTGINDGALIGCKIYSSSVTLDENKKDLSTVGFMVFIRYVHK